MAWEPDAPASEDIEVLVLDAPTLADAWPELDAFEGEEYARILVPVCIDGARWIANIYALRREMERSLEPPPA